MLGTTAVALVVSTGCQPVTVRSGDLVPAPIAVAPGDSSALNILAIGSVNPDGSFAARPHASGFTVTRGSTVAIAVIGPGMLSGTRVGVVGTGFVSTPIGFDTISGGSFDGQPVAVFSLLVPSYAEPGLYSVIAGRGTAFSVLAGSLEVQ